MKTGYAEIIVTAQRREQNLQDVGTSVTAFDANSVERLGLKDATSDIVGQDARECNSTNTARPSRSTTCAAFPQNDFSDHQEAADRGVFADDAYIAPIPVRSPARCSICSGSRCCAGRRARCSDATPPAASSNT